MESQRGEAKRSRLSRLGQALVGLVAAVGASTTAVLAGSSAAHASTPAANWLISETAINLVDGYLGSTNLTTGAFDNSSTEVSHGFPAAWSSNRTASYDAYGPASAAGSFLHALAAGTVPQGTLYVMYDDESWSMTPLAEQQDPGLYMDEFVAAAHAHGYKAIVAPALDLVGEMSCRRTSVASWTNYLTECDLPRLAAQSGADIYEVQGQEYENATTMASNCHCYAWFVKQAASQARAAHPGIDVYAGLSTNPAGAAEMAQTLYVDTLDTKGAVDGYWLNAPQKSTSCPTCLASGAPDVAAGYLSLLGYPGQLPQAISFASPAPASATAGDSYTPAVSGGASGNPVVLTVDESSTAGACAVGRGTISFTGSGTCLVDVDQAGNVQYAPTPPVQLRIAVAKEQSRASLAASATAVELGDEGTLRLEVTVSAARGVPSGTVAVRSGSTTLCTAKLAGGRGSCTPSWSALGAGDHALSAVYGGSSAFDPSTSGALGLRVDVAPQGYYLAGADGAVVGAGGVPALAGVATTSGPVTGIATTPDGRGYFDVTAGGVVHTAGDAAYRGDLRHPSHGGVVLVDDIVSIVPTSDGGGYWLVGADGSVYPFGDAAFCGDLLRIPGGTSVHVSDVVGMVPSPTGHGYLLIGADGGVFAFGAVAFFGSLPGLRVHVTDIRGILPAPGDTGYVLVGSDGGAFVFGHGAPFKGSLPGEGIRVHDIVGLALVPGGQGYWMAGADGAVYPFGDAAPFAAPAAVAGALPVTAIAAA